MYFIGKTAAVFLGAFEFLDNFDGYLLYTILGVVMLPGILLSVWASAKVSSTFRKYAGVSASSGNRGRQVARAMLDGNGCGNISIKQVSGELTDYFDPRKKVLALSQSTYDSSSIAALGVAGHEVGHAIQHKTGYLPIKIRSLLVPVVNLTSALMWPLVVIGFALSFFSPDMQINGFPIGQVIMWAGIIFFGASTLFTLITLPGEFNASKRAYKLLVSMNILTSNEADQAKKVLDAAALTYVAAFIASALSLIRFLLYIFLMSRRNNKR